MNALLKNVVAYMLKERKIGWLLADSDRLDCVKGVSRGWRARTESGAGNSTGDW